METYVVGYSVEACPHIFNGVGGAYNITAVRMYVLSVCTASPYIPSCLHLQKMVPPIPFENISVLES